jgi:hypothetical protein
MGLYDDVTVPIEVLKLQDDARIQKYVALLSGDSVSFQTKSLDCALRQYELKNIAGSYVLHLEHVETEFIKSDDPNAIFKFYPKVKSRSSNPELITSTLFVYDYYNSDTLDISIDLHLVLVSGVLVRVDCVKYEERDPAPRIKMLQETMSRMKETAAYYDTLRGRVALLIRRVLLATHRKAQNWINLLQEIAFKL